MNFTHTLKKNIFVATGIMFFAISVIATLFAFEAVTPLRFATNTANAWHCIEATAYPESIILGESSTLSWSFAADSNVTVTVNQIPGEEWTGVSGSVTVIPTETTVYTVVAHRTGTESTYECRATVTVLPPEEPNIPACPFTPSSDLIVVDFNGGKEKDYANTLFSNGIGSYEITSLTNLIAGTYTIKTLSWDGYSSRVSSSQPHEQWNIEIRNGSEVLGVTGPTTDLADRVFEDSKSDTFVESITTVVDGDTVAVVHYAYPDNTSPNSVVPVCVAFERKSVTEVPRCELNATPTSISEGGISQLTWNSEHVNSVDITNIGTGLAVSSSTTVAPATTTTYVGTFYGDNGDDVTCEATVTVRPQSSDPEPVCTLSASPSKVEKGDNTTLSWTSDEVVSAMIDQGIGAVDLNGSTSTQINANTTFTGTFIDDKGQEVTCSATVSIDTGGGGGSCLNCGGNGGGGGGGSSNDPEPTIILGKTITKTGSFITLDQVPYTGFKAGPLVTAFFWAMVIAVSVLIAYTLTRFRTIERVKVSLSGTEQNNTIHSNNMSVLAPVRNIPGITTSNIPSNSSSGHNSVTEIEDMAHRENVLLSPEALRIIQSKVENTEKESALYISELLEKAKADFPREDGWILLSKERVEGLFESKNTPISVEKTESTTNVSVKSNTSDRGTEERPFRVEQKQISKTKQTHNKPAETQDQINNTNVTKNTASTSPSQNLVSGFMDYLLNVQKKEAYELMRNITTRGVDVATFITLVVRQLDEVYKHRIEGNRNPDQELVNKTASWTNEDFEVVLGILVECIDYSYSNNRIGTKIALAKAFEHFDNK